MRGPALHLLLPVALIALLGADNAPPQGGAIAGTVIAVQDGKQVARDDVYVYLEQTVRPGAVTGRTPPGAGIKREIHQKGIAFVPHVLVVPVGAEVWFPNDDKDEHNVFSPTDPPFDLGRYRTDKKGKGHRFEDADEFDIFCDVHREMWAKVKVVDSAFYMPIKDGKFAFGNVPPGTYRVVAWTSNSPEVKSDKIVVSTGGSITLPSALHLQVTLKSGCHDHKDGTPYDAKYGRYSRCPQQR